MSKLLKYSQEKGYHAGELGINDTGGFLGKYLKRLPYLFLKSKAKIICPVRRGVARWERITSYTPSIASGAYFALNFDTKSIVSKDILIYVHSGNTFKVGKEHENKYRISAYWEINLSNPGSIQSDEVGLYLYKNGSLYSTLDRKHMKVQISETVNQYLAFRVLTGQDQIVLNESDVFSIRLMHMSANPFDNTITHKGYFNICFKDAV